ncbi:outer membrane protein assembly factor BamA [Aestuariivita boseongensis]|uniref:outer membrane protein assembly factor BamA n=1 Tax=Aestuariivita boseongensis TaxID=1470562 RepID=UPI000682EF47|nr:outer membrane protein assembly factor BamA [Aestuariivita boseongensis]
MGIFLAFATVLAVSGSPAYAQTYRFNSVVVEGNQRIDTATIATYAGIGRGQAVTGGELNDAYERILDSGLFETVELEPRGSTLVIRVTEFPTINRINFEGNRRIDDEDLAGFIESQPRRVFNPTVAERDANTIAEAYAQQGRVSATVTPRIIRRSENRVDLIFEIGESGVIEVERVSFVGNRAYSDRRLRRVLETKQANFLRAFIRADTLIEDRVEFDKQVLTDFYRSRGYIDFRVNSANAELTEERDAFFLVVNVTEGQQFKFGEITTVSEYDGVEADEYQDSLRIKPGVVYSPSLVENSIARMERLAVRNGVDFLRIEPRITRNDRDLTLDVEFVLTRGPRVFVERIDIEGNTATLDRVVRRQFRVVEGDPFNPREIRESAERIRALGYFSEAAVEAREGSSTDQVIVDVDVEEQPTGSLSLGGSYSRNNGFGIAIGLQETNFLGRGQTVGVTWSGAEDAEQYVFSFTEPYLLGRDLRFDLNIGYVEEQSGFSNYDSDRLFFQPSLSFPLGERTRLSVRYFFNESEMKTRPGAVTSATITNEIAQGSLSATGIGYTFSYDSRLVGLNPNAGVLFEFGQDFAGLGGDNEYIKTSARIIAQTRVLNEEVTLRASLEGGALSWSGTNASRVTDRFLLTPAIMRGFEPAGLGPRDQSAGVDDAIGGNLFAVARFEAEFPIGLPEELGIRGGVFYDIGNLWDLKDANTAGGTIVGANGSFRQVIGLSLFWDTPLGPLRFNFTHALEKEAFDKEQTFDFTLSTTF